jgi:hypothetical protein
MASWTHLIRFVAVEDDKTYLGQLVDTARDIGIDSLNGIPIYAFVVEGSIYSGRVTDRRLQIRKVCCKSNVPLLPELSELTCLVNILRFFLQLTHKNVRISAA